MAITGMNDNIGLYQSPFEEFRRGPCPVPNRDRREQAGIAFLTGELTGRTITL